MDGTSLWEALQYHAVSWCFSSSNLVAPNDIEFDICAGVRKECVLSSGLLCSVPRRWVSARMTLNTLGSISTGMSHLLALGLLWISAGSRHHVSRFGDIRGTRWNETQRIQNQGFDDAKHNHPQLNNPCYLAIGSFESHNDAEMIVCFSPWKTLASDNITSTVVYNAHHRRFNFTSGELEMCR